tara:strand:- start:7119 stop:7370 length:252 start_codon:yes stop_codon:yes gene_type:complete
MTGTVTISLKDYHKLVESKTNLDTLKDNTAYSIKELQVFLSFICSRKDINTHIDEFNRQSKRSKIVIQNGKAVIQKKDEKNRI